MRTGVDPLDVATCLSRWHAAGGQVVFQLLVILRHQVWRAPERNNRKVTHIHNAYLEHKQYLYIVQYSTPH